MTSRILIVDYGSQYTQLIARNIRENSVYSEVHPFNKINKRLIKRINPIGIILSGGPNSVLKNRSPKLPKIIINIQKYGQIFHKKNLLQKIMKILEM